jgi:hypothetical protein
VEDWGFNSGLLTLCQHFFVLGVFKTGSLKLFIQAGLELRSS